MENKNKPKIWIDNLTMKDSWIDNKVIKRCLAPRKCKLKPSFHTLYMAETEKSDHTSGENKEQL